ncbi:Guanylate-binding protein 5 [Branchiostoma belcheri]|nr:Guanylate-binding protein 5 [Branchiostoma belcheri]
MSRDSSTESGLECSASALSPVNKETYESDMSWLYCKHGFKLEELKPKADRKTAQGSSIPLILPDDMKYNAVTGGVEKVPDAKRTTLHVVPEALELLEGIEEPVSVISICGLCRTGKSYILSRLLDTADAFALGHWMDPQTFGIWMGTKVLRGKDFTIVLLDTEGIDAAGDSACQDTSILVLTILLSCQLIYNSLNVPYKGDLEKMQCFIKVAKGITVKKGERTQMSAFREFFPDFLWLLRDVSLMITDEDGNDMDPSWYLKTRVLARQGEDDFDVSISDRVGRAILTFFSSVECATLERPSEKREVMSNIAQYTDSLNPEFNKGVNALAERLLLKSCAKRGYDKGSTVSGLALSIMVKQYVEAVNSPHAIPALDNTWQNTVELMRVRTSGEVVEEYNQQMQERMEVKELLTRIEQHLVDIKGLLVELLKQPPPLPSQPNEDVHVKVHFEKVINNVSYKWDDLARELGFGRSEIKGIETTEPSPNQRCREVLERWRNRKGMEATLQVLKQALIDIGERLTAESFKT